jgi:hypothetical protein
MIAPPILLAGLVFPWGAFGHGDNMASVCEGREMNEHEERALKYRQKAAELRGMVSGIKNQEGRDAVEKMASNYERLARVQETLAKADEASCKS